MYLFECVTALFRDVSNAFQLGSGCIILEFASEVLLGATLAGLGLVGDATEAQQTKLQSLRETFGPKVQVERYGTQRLYKLAVVGVPTTISAEDAARHLKFRLPIPAVVATEERGRSHLRTLIFSFQDESFVQAALADGQVRLGFTSYTVEAPNKRLPLQCFNCQRFGHVARICRHDARCRNCSGAHKTKSCKVATHKCANCDGPRKASALPCPKNPINKPKSRHFRIC